jgi:hypothetical protein
MKEGNEMDANSIASIRLSAAAATNAHQGGRIPRESFDSKCQIWKQH